jgi:putative transposase
VRDEGLVRNKAIHIALGVRADGTKDVLGSGSSRTRAPRRQVLAADDERAQEPRHRGLLAVVDGLKGFPEAIRAVFPEATVQTCIVHLLRHSLDFVSYKDRKAVAAALKDIYRAVVRPPRPWMPSMTAHGARNTRPSSRAGAAPGPR